MASNITDFFFTGYLEARENNGTVYAGILKVIDVDLVYSNVRSAEVSYLLSSTVTPITTQALYNNMFGQSPVYSSTYTQLRSSLNTTYWSTNFSNITASSLWTYNATTHLYELVI